MPPVCVCGHSYSQHGYRNNSCDYFGFTCSCGRYRRKRAVKYNLKEDTIIERLLKKAGIVPPNDGGSST